MSETENKKQNKITAKAGLTFNVNAVKSKLKDYHATHGVENPKYGGGQTAMTAVLEKFYELVLRECLKRLGKQKSGLKEVNVEFLQATVLLNMDMKDYCVTRLSHFDTKQMYRDQVPFDTKQMDQVMARVDKDLALTPNARNLACYLLLQVFLDLTSTCDHLQAYAGKKTLDGNCVIHASRICFSSGLAKEFCEEVVRVMKEFDVNLESDETDVVKKPDATPNAAAEDDNESAQTKTNKKGKETKADKDTKSEKQTVGKKNQKAQKVEDDNDNENESDDDHQSDEEVEVQPKKGKGKEQTKEQSASGNKKGQNQSGKNKPAKNSK